MSHEARVNSVSWKFAFHVFKQLKAQHGGGGGGVGGRWGERRQVPLTLRGSGAEGPVRGHRACELGLCFPAGCDPRFSSVALLRRQPRVASSPDQLSGPARSRVPVPRRSVTLRSAWRGGTAIVAIMAISPPGSEARKARAGDAAVRPGVWAAARTTAQVH